MAFQIPLLIQSGPTEVDLSADYGMGVVYSSGKVILASGNNPNTINPAGILQNTPKGATGKPVTADIGVLGVFKCLAGGTIHIGDLIGLKSDGSFIALAAGTDTTVYAIGRAQEEAASGQLFAASCNLMNSGRAT